jgi:hypothetical protein
MLIFFGVMTAIMAVGVALTERVDRPRRRQARLEAIPAE